MEAVATQQVNSRDRFLACRLSMCISVHKAPSTSKSIFSVFASRVKCFCEASTVGFKVIWCRQGTKTLENEKHMAREHSGEGEKKGTYREFGIWTAIRSLKMNEVL